MISVRLAALADLPRLQEIRAAVTENRLQNPALATTANYLWFLTNPGIFLAEANGVAAGFAAADPRDGSIWALFVAPEYERRGIGRLLLARACATLLAAGHTTAWLTTAPGTRPDRFYRAAGWQPSGHTGNQFRFEAAL